MVRAGTLDDVVEDGTFSRRRLQQAWRLLNLPVRIDRQHAVAVTIVSLLIGDRAIGETDALAARTVLKLVGEAWERALLAPGVYLLWRGGRGQLHYGDPYEASVDDRDGAIHVYDLHEWATGPVE